MKLASVLIVLAACGSKPSAVTYHLADLPITEWTGGLPVSGDGKLVVDVTPAHPTDWSKANGHITFTCDGCRLGDDRATMKPPGTTFPPIRFGSLVFPTVNADIAIADGHMQLVAHMRSPDLELAAKVSGTLVRAGADTKLDGCVRWKPTAALRTSDPKLYSMTTLTGGAGDESSGFSIQIAGTIGAMILRGQACNVD